MIRKTNSSSSRSPCWNSAGKKIIEMCNFRWKTSHATISYSNGGGWKNKRRLSRVCRLQLKRVSFSTSNFTKMYSANVPVWKDGFPFEMGADTKHSLLWVMGVAKPNFNTVHPNNGMHIPHTVRHTFPKVLTRRICLKICPVVGDQRIK